MPEQPSGFALHTTLVALLACYIALHQEMARLFPNLAAASPARRSAP